MPSRGRSNSLTGYGELVRSWGLDPAALLRQVGLEPADLDVPDVWVPAAPMSRLLELTADLAGRPDLALRLAEHRTLGTLGPLSVVLREEPDLRSTLRLLAQYNGAYNESLHLELREDGESPAVRLWFEFGEPAPRDQALDLAMASLLGIVRALVDPRWAPRSAVFSRPPPADPAPWHRLFGPDVVFAAPETCLVLRARDLDRPVTASDSSLRPYARQFLRHVVAPLPPAPALTDVVQALQFLLPLGRQSLSRTSRLVGLSDAALQRHLAEHGETFSTVLDATRAGLAERHLADEQLPLTEVSRRLGFSAPSGFSRWFRQRFGTSPSRWRRAARDGAVGSVPPRS
ncbi:AraC family transcriptional regulator [Blastococcus sp. SYSU D00695]